MNKVRFFLKFGKREHLESFAAGNLFCSNAITFWEIEKKLRIKGQGDILEAGSRMFGQKMYMQELGTDKVTLFDLPSTALVHYEPAEKIPVFCMFSVFDSDCEYDADGNVKIRLSDKTKCCIREHFPNADTVAIISNPEMFISDVKNTIGCRIEHDCVHYYHIAEGLETDRSGQIAMDMEYLKYLVQDVPPVVENGKKTYSFLAKYVYRALLCKDVFFSDEQEYRIVLPDETITEGTLYPVKLSEVIPVVSLDDFMK